MPHYSGITTDLKTRKAVHKENHPTLTNWTVANDGKAFPSLEKAQKWESKQPGEHHESGNDSDSVWYGYSFDY